MDGRSVAGPESCEHGGNDMGEALTGVRAGRAIEPRSVLGSGRRRCPLKRKATPGPPLTPGGQGPAGSENPFTCVDFFDGNREIHRLAAADGGVVRAWNPQGASGR